MRNVSMVVIACLTTALLAPPLHALKTGGTIVILPTIGRVPGALGTQWVTDVYVSTIGAPAAGTMKFYVADGTMREESFTLEAHETKTYRDIVRTVFGLEIASGQLHLEALPGSVIEARARIYNAGHPAGEFGQGMEGISPSWLQSQARLFGLDGSHGSRVNVGVANPNGATVTVDMLVKYKANLLYYKEITLQPYQTVQFNDIFGLFNIPAQDNVTVDLWARDDYRIYGYASEVRNDTGDAVFVFGSGPNASLNGPTGAEVQRTGGLDGVSSRCRSISMIPLR